MTSNRERYLRESLEVVDVNVTPVEFPRTTHLAAAAESVARMDVAYLCVMRMPVFRVRASPGARHEFVGVASPGRDRRGRGR